MCVHICRKKGCKKIPQDINRRDGLMNDFNFVLSTFLCVQGFFSFSPCHEHILFCNQKIISTGKQNKQKRWRKHHGGWGLASGAEVWDSALTEARVSWWSGWEEGGWRRNDHHDLNNNIDPCWERQLCAGCSSLTPWRWVAELATSPGVSLSVPGFFVLLTCVCHRTPSQPHCCLCSRCGGSRVPCLQHKTGACRPWPCVSCRARPVGHGGWTPTTAADAVLSLHG